MNAREKVSLQEFSIDTALDPEAIHDAGRRAAEAGTRFMESKILEDEVTDSTINYAINSSGGIFSQRLMDLIVGWQELGDGKRRVSLGVGEFATSRWELWGFIPISPKSPTALGSLKGFSARLRRDLS